MKERREKGGAEAPVSPETNEAAAAGGAPAAPAPQSAAPAPAGPVARANELM